MPLPFILGAAAAAAAAGGIGSGIYGGVKIKNAKELMQLAQNCHENNIKIFEDTNKRTTASMDKLGKLELEIISSFSQFADVIEVIQNRPIFKKIDVNGARIPTYSPEELKKTSVGANVLLGGLGGAAAGTAGGFAAAGATMAAVTALGTASTGTAIASLSGAAATNAALAALGGGSLAAGGGGMALGTAVLGGAAAGVGLLFCGGMIAFTGNKLSNKAEEAWEQMKKAENEMNKGCAYLNDLKNCAELYITALQTVKMMYKKYLSRIKAIVFTDGKTDWYDFTPDEQLAVENCSYLVGMLYNMCKVKVVLKTKNSSGYNAINKDELSAVKGDAVKLLKQCMG